jgi:hypothetical protein
MGLMSHESKEQGVVPEATSEDSSTIVARILFQGLNEFSDQLIVSAWNASQASMSLPLDARL